VEQQEETVKEDWKSDPQNPENQICKCGHSRDRHVVGHNVKHCKGDPPVPRVDGIPWTLLPPCLCSLYDHDRNK
jgi:hypothetical protein